MQSVENTRRELFEDWFKDANETRLSRGFDDYTGWEKLIMCRAFNAALDSVVIELPDRFNDAPPYSCYEGGWNDMRDEAKDAIESTNLGLKVK